MRILFDECVNPRLRLAFPGETVKTVAQRGWRSLTNGRLMEAAASQFDILITLDRNLPFQNAATRYSLGIVVLITRLNHVSAYRPPFGEIRDIVMHTKPGQVNVLQIRYSTP